MMVIKTRDYYQEPRGLARPARVDYHVNNKCRKGKLSMNISVRSRLKCNQLVNFNQRRLLRRLLGVHLESRALLVRFLATRRITGPSCNEMDIALARSTSKVLPLLI